jgi:hypothetical protein
MKRFTVFSAYRQFYVADAGLDADAPVEWNDAHIAQRHNTLRHIVALCPENDISARIVSCGPDDVCPQVTEPAAFEVFTEVEIVSGKIGVFGWPRELEDEYQVQPGIYSVRFSGFALEKAATEEDYYTVVIRKKQNQSTDPTLSSVTPPAGQESRLR